MDHQDDVQLLETAFQEMTQGKRDEDKFNWKAKPISYQDDKNLTPEVLYLIPVFFSFCLGAWKNS